MRKRAPGRKLLGVPADMLRMTIEIEVGAAPIRGWLTSTHAPARRFESWLDLVSFLDQEIAAGGTSPDPHVVAHPAPDG